MDVRGLLLDLEGVLYEGDTPIPGVADALSALAASGFEIRYLTNTTTRPRRAIVDRLLGMGFDLALADLGLDAVSVAMVGDDIEADIGGAKRAGMTTIQVKTGKFTPKDREHPSIRPDYLINSAADLPSLLLALEN